MKKQRDSIQERDSILWQKLRIWQLIDYRKIVMLDSDLMVLKNSDELFEFPEFASTPMVKSKQRINPQIDSKEKNLFFKSSRLGYLVRNKPSEDHEDMNVMHWSGVNSGVSVLKPDFETFEQLITELSILPQRLVRWCQ
jgi:alpha-N-acetylglucosamine transferase